MLSIIDLFAGCGGFSYGFLQAGNHITQALEIDKWAAETFNANIESAQLIMDDVRNFSNETIQSKFDNHPDVLIGGPPCQGFSHSNVVNKDPKDPRNSLFEEFLRFASVLEPQICIIENVPGLLRTETANSQSVIKIILKRFEEIGYKATYKILNAANFGVPQYRERLFIAAVPVDSRTEFSWPVNTHSDTSNLNRQLSIFTELSEQKAITLWDAISDLPQIYHQDYSENLEYPITPQNQYQRLMRAKMNQYICNHEPMRHTKRIVERFKQIHLGMSEGDVPDEHKPRQRGEASKFSGKSYGQNSRRQHPERPSNTIVASSHTNFIHPYLHRNFTVRELARLQSFPDNFIFCGKRAVLSKKLSARKGLEVYLDQRMQVGNAVPPLLAQALARSASDFIFQENI